MKNRRTRTFQALILTLLGFFLLERVWSGKILLYINQRFVILVVLAGIGLIALAQAVFVERRKEGTLEEPSVLENNDPEPNTIEPHSRGSNANLIWLLVPLAFGLLIPVRPLGTSSLANRGIQMMAPFQVQNSPGTVALETPAGNRTVLDWIRAFHSAGDALTLANEPADVIGFIYHDPRLKADQFLLGRYTVACCIADATAIGITINWADSAALENNSWVRVQGEIQVGQLEGQKIPMIQADQVIPIQAPDQPYLFP
jgi:putative membrane protein